MTSEKILTAARQLFEDKGFDQTSVRDIAAQAGVNVALINYHFQSKENLLLTILETSMDSTRMKLTDLNNSDLTPQDKLREVTSMYVNKVFANCRYYQFIHREFANNNRPELADSISKIVNKNSLELRKLLEDGQKKKIFKKDADIELIVATMFGIIYQTTHVLFGKRYRRAGEKDDAYRKRIEAFMYDLLISYLEK